MTEFYYVNKLLVQTSVSQSGPSGPLGAMTDTQGDKKGLRCFYGSFETYTRYSGVVDKEQEKEK